MKIVYILNSSILYEGSVKSFNAMLDGLIKEGVKPLVIMPMKGDFCKYLESKNIPYLVQPFHFSRYPRITKWDLLKDIFMYLPRLFRVLIYNRIAISKLSRHIKNFDPDFIHTNVGPIHIGLELAHKMKIPHIWHLREYQKLDFNMTPLFSMKSFIKKLHSKGNYCISITKGIYDYFALDERSTVVYNGVLKEENLMFNPNKDKYFLFAGRLEPSKGIQNLIPAFIEFAKTNSEYKLYIAGDSSDSQFKKLLSKAVSDNGLDEQVLFLGMRDDVYDLMSMATALIVPSLSEGFGRITVEAIFNGCLVVGYNNAGTKEILSSENLGLLYDNQEELVDHLKSIAEKGIEKWYPMIEKAQKQAVLKYTQEQNVELIYKFYKEIYAKH